MPYSYCGFSPFLLVKEACDNWYIDAQEACVFYRYVK